MTRSKNTFIYLKYIYNSKNSIRIYESEIRLCLSDLDAIPCCDRLHTKIISLPQHDNKLEFMPSYFYSNLYLVSPTRNVGGPSLSIPQDQDLSCRKQALRAALAGSKCAFAGSVSCWQKNNVVKQKIHCIIVQVDTVSYVPNRILDNP